MRKFRKLIDSSNILKLLLSSLEEESFVLTVLFYQVFLDLLRGVFYL